MKRLLSLLLVIGLLLLVSCEAGTTGNETTGPDTNAPDTKPADTEPADGRTDPPDTGYGADRLYDFEKGAWLSDSTGDLTVGFLGGTASSTYIQYDPYGFVTASNTYCNQVLWMMHEMFPDRDLFACAGTREKTGAAYAASVFGDMVLQYAPDLVILELTAGDMELEKEEIEAGFVSIVKQAAGAGKIPVLLLLQTAVYERDGQVYEKWAETAAFERELAGRYGIFCADMETLLDAKYRESGDADADSFRAPYFSSTTVLSEDGLRLFADTARDAFGKADPAALLTKLDPEKTGTQGTDHIAFGTERLTLSGDWQHYTWADQFDPSETESGDLMKIEAYEYMYPYHYDGILQAQSEGASAAFDTSADELYMRLQTTMRGGHAAVTVDGEFWGTVNSNNRERKNPLTDEELYTDKIENVVERYETETVRIRLPGDGASHHVEITVNACEGSHLVFRFGSIEEITEGGSTGQLLQARPASGHTGAKTYAADELLGPDGKFGNDSEGELRIAYIGGSLTEGQFYSDPTGACLPYPTWYGANEWTQGFLRYCERCFPNRHVTAYGAGHGGTGSDFCTVRYSFCAADLNADIVFIDSCVNDAGKDRAGLQIHMEDIIRQALASEHVPVLIFLTMPFAYEPDSPDMEGWYASAAAKKEIADYYGVPTINVYDYDLWKYETSGHEGSFLSYIGQWYYNGNDVDGYDVHGGYALDLEAILKAFEEDPASIVRRIEEPETGFESDVYRPAWSEYRYLRADDPRIRYEGDWAHINGGDPFVADHFDVTGLEDYEPSDTHYAFPSAAGDDGWMVTAKQGTVTFDTDADSLILYAEHSLKGNQADVWIDGVKTEQVLDWSSPYGHMIYLKEIELPGDGETHTVRLEVHDPVPESYWISIGYVVERYRTDRAHG